MVDFQSRDRKRGVDGESDDEADPGEAEATEAGDASDGATADEPTEETETETDHHHDHGADLDELGVAVLTVSSTRSLDDDPSGDVIEAVVEGAGHEVVTRDLVSDDLDTVQSRVDSLADRGDVDSIVTTGGTGVTPDDVTVEAVEPLFDKTLPGFGELFRSLSFEQIGTRIVATRATAGVVDGVPVFCLPGSEDAAHLGTEEIVVPEVDHLAELARRPE